MYDQRLMMRDMEIAWSLRDAQNMGGLSRLIIHKKTQYCGFIDGVPVFAAPTWYLVCAMLSDTQRSTNVHRYNMKEEATH